MGLCSCLLEPLTVGFGRTLSGALRSFGGALSLLSTPRSGSLLAKCSLLSLVGQPRLMLDLGKETATTSHFVLQRSTVGQSMRQTESGQRQTVVTSIND